MKQQTKIFLLVALSFLSSFNLSANDTFFSIEKSSDSLEVLANSVDDWFNLSTLKNLTAKIPSGSKLTYLKKSDFIANGYKVKPNTGSSIKTTVDDIIANGDNLGLKTETAVRDILESKNYTWIDAKYGSNNGYDGLFIKGTKENPTEIIIVESKQFKYSNNKAGDLIEHSGVSLSPPSTTTPLPAQMSDGWVRYVARKLEKAGKTDIADMILDNPGLIKKYVSAVDKVQGEINFLKLGNY